MTVLYSDLFNSGVCYKVTAMYFQSDINFPKNSSVHTFLTNRVAISPISKAVC